MTMTPMEAARQYRSDRSNRFFGYGGVVTPDGKGVQSKVDGRYWFLLRKLHLLNYVNVTGSPSITYLARFIDEARRQACQNVQMAPCILGGNGNSPNVLPAPMLFGPTELMQLELDRVPTRVHWHLEGEHITNPDPAWVSRMQRRSWYQLGLLDMDTTGTQSVTYGDDKFDFAIMRILSLNGVAGVIANANPGKMKIRSIGPVTELWSNDEVSNLVYAGVYGFGAGPRPLVTPRIITNGTKIEVQTRAIPDVGYEDIVFDGVKYPAGTRLEDWLDTAGL